MSDSIPLLQQDLKSIFSSYDFVASYTCQAETMPAYLMAITHAVWHHSNIGQLTLIPRLLVVFYITILHDTIFLIS